MNPIDSIGRSSKESPMLTNLVMAIVMIPSVAIAFYLMTRWASPPITPFEIITSVWHVPLFIGAGAFIGEKLATYLGYYNPDHDQ